MNLKNPYVMSAGSFLLAWTGSNFDLNYRSILCAILVGVFGYSTPVKK